MTTILDLGKLTSQTNWRGGISAANMLADGFTSESMLDDAVRQLEQFYVAEDETAEARCIDGRCCSALPEDCMGPQLPGGTPGAGIAYRLSLIGDDFEIGDFVGDAHTLLEMSVKVGMVPGDHRDTHGHGVGCGAIDKMDVALAAMLAPELVADHKRLVKQLLGDQFSDELYMQVLGAGVVLEGRIDEYMANREKSIEELENNLKHKVSILEGDHHECFVLINLVSGTTFATKRFSDEFNGVQAFNYDVWRTVEFAQKAFPDEAFRNRFVTARVMTAVATLMVLTDGSQRLIVRS